MSADIQRAFVEQLQAAGLAVTHVVADGRLHRCGTVDKPRSRNGAYIVHMDAPASLWWQNWQSGDSGTWTAKEDKGLTAAERKTLRQRIEAAKAEARAEQEKRWAAAAKLAAIIWEKSTPADPGHPYLQRKGVLPLGGIRQTEKALLVPVKGEDSKLQSLQYILSKKPLHGPEKPFLKGGKTKGGFFHIPARDGSKDGPLLICEGYATGASLHMATGYAVLVAFSAGNLEAVARMARIKYAEREIVLCADNDCTTTRQDGSLWNPGKEAAIKAVQAVGGKLAVCPAHEGRPSDFNDLHRLRSLEAVRAVTEKARRQDADCPMPDGFFLIKEGPRAGLYKRETKADGDSYEIRLGPPLLVKGLTRDTDGNEWGLMLEWQDPDKRTHLWAMPQDLLFKPAGEWYAQLVAGGWRGSPGTKAKLAAFLSIVHPLRRVRCVPRTGWDNAAYVLPDAVYGESNGEAIVLQSLHHAGLYRCGGTLEGWQELAALAVGNTRPSFALCAGFAGPLLRLAGLEGGGFSFEGGSSSGKTTALQIAASVWGGPEHVRSWRATDNGLEGVAALHNDNLLVLDEVGQVSGRVLAESAYMLANGQGKGRSGRDGNLRRSHSWNLLFLSSGELGLADKLAESGLKSRAGQEVRFVGVPVDKGMLSNLHGLPSAGTLASRMKELAARHYGHAGRVFLQTLTRGQELEALRQEVSTALVDTVARLAPVGGDGQVWRVAQRFAICAVAGYMAMRAGLLPSSFDPLGSVQACFDDWLTARGGAGPAEDTAILSRVRFFIEQHGASRFQDLDTQANTCINRVGFRRKLGDSTEFIILPESFKSEVIPGFSMRRVCEVLRHAGWLRQSEGRNTTKRELPDMGRVRVYVLVMPDDTEPEDDLPAADSETAL